MKNWTYRVDLHGATPKKSKKRVATACKSKKTPTDVVLIGVELFWITDSTVLTEVDGGGICCPL